MLMTPVMTLKLVRWPMSKFNVSEKGNPLQSGLGAGGLWAMSYIYRCFGDVDFRNGQVLVFVHTKRKILWLSMCEVLLDSTISDWFLSTSPKIKVFFLLEGGGGQEKWSWISFFRYVELDEPSLSWSHLVNKPNWSRDYISTGKLSDPVWLVLNSLSD